MQANEQERLEAIAKQIVAASEAAFLRYEAQKREEEEQLAAGEREGHKWALYDATLEQLRTIERAVEGSKLNQEINAGPLTGDSHPSYRRTFLKAARAVYLKAHELAESIPAGASV